MNDVVIANPQVHVMYGGVSYDIDFTEIDLPHDATDARLREAVANFLNQPPAKLTNFVIDRNVQTGDITMRPQAIFGRC